MCAALTSSLVWGGKMTRLCSTAEDPSLKDNKGEGFQWANSVGCAAHLKFAKHCVGSRLVRVGRCVYRGQPLLLNLGS